MHPTIASSNPASHQDAVFPLMFGLPDDMMVGLHSITPQGTSSFRVPGSASFLPYLDATLRARLATLYFGPALNLSINCSGLGLPLINNIADADVSRISLGMLERLISQMRSPCFNHPRSVLDTGRDRVASKLEKIADLQVPRTIRLRIDEPKDLVVAAAQARIDFPLIVRIAGVHGGLSTVRIDAAEDVSKALRGIPWGGRDLYLSEYVAYRDMDGRHRKMRLVVVGKQVFLRHLIATEDWHVHAQDRDAAAAEEEIAALEHFETRILPLISDRVQAIADSLDLDYFGIDCNLRPDGRLLIFEANASMNILLNSSPSPNCWDRPIRSIHDALARLLFRPSDWRHAHATVTQ